MYMLKVLEGESNGKKEEDRKENGDGRDIRGEFTF